MRKIVVLFVLLAVLVMGIGAAPVSASTSGATAYIQFRSVTCNWGYLPGTYVEFRNEMGILRASGYVEEHGYLYRTITLFPAEQLYVYAKPYGGPQVSAYLVTGCAYGSYANYQVGIVGMFGWECGENLSVTVSGSCRPSRN